MRRARIQRLPGLPPGYHADEKLRHLALITPKGLSAYHETRGSVGKCTTVCDRLCRETPVAVVSVPPALVRRCEHHETGRWTSPSLLEPGTAFPSAVAVQRGLSCMARPQGLAPITLQRPQEALQALLELGGRGFGVQHQRRSERLMAFEVAGASCGSRSLSVWF